MQGLRKVEKEHFIPKYGCKNHKNNGIWQIVIARKTTF